MVPFLQLQEKTIKTKLHLIYLPLTREKKGFDTFFHFQSEAKKLKIYIMYVKCFIFQKIRLLIYP